MTNGRLQAPSVAEMVDLAVELVPVEGLGVVSLRAKATDGDTVTLTWDELARAFTVWWRAPDRLRMRIERELATTIAVREDRGAVELRCSIQGSDLAGDLVVRVAEHVTLSDVLLRY